MLPLNPSQKHVRSMVPYHGNANPLKITKIVNTRIYTIKCDGKKISSYPKKKTYVDFLLGSLLIQLVLEFVNFLTN